MERFTHEHFEQDSKPPFRKIMYNFVTQQKMHFLALIRRSKFGFPKLRGSKQ